MYIYTLIEQLERVPQAAAAAAANQYLEGVSPGRRYMSHSPLRELPPQRGTERIVLPRRGSG